MLPTEDSLVVAEELARRWGLPSWQFTLSASQANMEALRLARHATGRRKILSFTGNYGGHGDEMLTAFAAEGRLSYLGLVSTADRDLDVIQFNDVGELEEALAGEEYACVFTEPALTNEGVVLPEPGFHEALRRLSHEAGTLLLLDETHTLVCGPGGLTEKWGLEPDLVVVGKAIGGGLPLGAYGMSAELAAAFERGASLTGEPGELATGGTLFANALGMAAARAALTEVLTLDAYEHAAALGAELADRLEDVVHAAELPWKVQRLWPRSGISFSGRLARNAAEADADEQPELNALLRLYLANRGVWRRSALPARRCRWPRPATTSRPTSPPLRHSSGTSPRRADVQACRLTEPGPGPGPGPQRRLARGELEDDRGPARPRAQQHAFAHLQHDREAHAQARGGREPALERRPRQSAEVDAGALITNEHLQCLVAREDLIGAAPGVTQGVDERFADRSADVDPVVPIREAPGRDARDNAARL